MRRKIAFLASIALILQLYSCANTTYKDPANIEIPGFGILKFAKRLFKNECITDLVLIDNAAWVFAFHSNELCTLNLSTEKIARYPFDEAMQNDSGTSSFASNLYYINDTLIMFYEWTGQSGDYERKMLQFNVMQHTYSVVRLPDALRKTAYLFSIIQHANDLYLYTTENAYYKSKDCGNTWIGCTEEEYDEFSPAFTMPETIAGNLKSYYKDNIGKYILTENNQPYYTVTNLNVSVNAADWYFTSLGTNCGETVRSKDSRVYVAASYYLEGMGFIPLISLGGGLLIFDWIK